MKPSIQRIAFFLLIGLPVLLALMPGCGGNEPLVRPSPTLTVTPMSQSTTAWSKTYGGVERVTQGYVMESTATKANSIRQTSDGGYILAGDHEIDLLWIVKLNAYGAMQWQEVFDIAPGEYVSVHLASDGGYMVATTTGTLGAGSRDVWLVKLNQSGNIQWSKTYGDRGYQELKSICPTSDGGAAMVMESPNSGYDLLLLKVDSKGDIEWKKVLNDKGVGNGMNVKFILQTAEGGYVMSGSISIGGSGGVMMLKLDRNGNILWQKVYQQEIQWGISGGGVANSVDETVDGGYVLAGTTSLGAGGGDVFVLKLDQNGYIQWQVIYGGVVEDEANCISQTSDGGYVVAGATKSFGINGTYDFWVLKFDASGAIQWQKTYGGIGKEYAYFLSERAVAIQQTSDDGYILTGTSPSFDPEGTSVSKAWVLKLKNDGSIGYGCPAGIETSTNTTLTSSNLTAKVISDIFVAPDVNITVTSPNVIPSGGKARERNQC